MSPIPGTYTVQVYCKTGMAKVIGVMDERMHAELISYIIKSMHGEKEKDWYMMSNDKELFGVVMHAKKMDSKAMVYDVNVRAG